MLTIVHSGQSGVERGAYRAAVAMGLPVAGYMPATGRDEFGTLPLIVREHLVTCGSLGARRAVLANIALASAALVIVPDVTQPHRYTGIPTALKAVRAAAIPLKLVDPRTVVDDIIQWARTLPADGIRLMVHGPRATRWHEGEALGWKLVATLAMH